MSYRLRDVRKSSYRAVPVEKDLSIADALLKSLCERLHPLGEPFERFGDRRVGLGIELECGVTAGPHLLELVGEQQLARLPEAAEGAFGFARLAMDDRADRAEMVFLAVAAGDRIFAPGDLE